MTTPTRAAGVREEPRSIFSPGVRSASVGATVLIAIFALEYIAVGAAMPTVAAALDGYHLYNMAFGATVAASVVGMIVGGWWSDRSGPRPVVLGGGAAFVAGLLVAGLATSMEVFVVGRGLQGLGSGLASVALYVVIAQRVPDALRPPVFSLLAAAWVLPGLAGPLLTGLVVEHLSWRWVFLGVAPGFLLALVVLRPALRATRPSSEAGHLRPGIIGWAVLAAVGVGLLNLAGERIQPWEYALGAVLLVLLAVAAHHLLPRGALALARGLPSVIGVRAALGASFVAAEAYLPLMLRDEHGYSPAQAGGVLAAASVTWALGSWFQGRAAPEGDRYRLMLAGVLGYAVVMAVLGVGVWGSWPGWVVIALYGLATFGVGVAYPNTSVLTLRLSSEQEVGRNSSALQVGEALASALALAATGVVFGLTYGTAPHAAFVGTLVVSVAVGLLSVLSAARARPARTASVGPAV
ncbi:multidrug transporter [Serinicoccus chungangensis]|uniref:Multidrug transporter n=1 Tax=Serinicoccus chungangensis TaxID=767452 RepID=A0A0W8I1A4_9MICO|nr:MFS transporter [Serinicoccus chungangensis]KUG51509.1 multidrug transporter [Serinicoccus chungangensis]